MNSIHRLAVGVVLSVLVILPNIVVAQWVEKPGNGWLQVSVFHHETSRRFDERSRIESLFNEGGRSNTTSVIATGVVGVFRGVDIWAQVPFHYLEFNDVVEDRTSTGIGDPRFHVRIGPELFLGKPLPIPIALRAGVKFSVGEFPIDSEIIPLTEGQRDWELILEIGKSFWPRTEYTMLWIGYRWREENREVLKKPGNEFFFLANAGGTVRSLNWKMGVEGLFGRSWEIFRINVASASRRVVQLLPSVGRNVGPGGLEIGARIPLIGRNLPAGPALFFGYFFRFGH